MEYLIVSVIAVLCLGLILFIFRRFVTKTYPQKIEKMLDSLLDLTAIGLMRNQSGFNGTHRGYFVSVFATTSITGHEVNSGDQFQVMIATAPESGQLKQIGGFFSQYIVTGEKDGFAYVGMRINAGSILDAQQTIVECVNQLINILVENNIKPYVG